MIYKNIRNISFKSLFKRNKNMDENIISDSVSEEKIEQVHEKEKKQYQWVKGETIGDVETFKEYKEKNGRNWVCFKSGRRIDASLLSEMMIEINDRQPPLELGLSTDWLGQNNKQLERIEPKNPILALLEKQKKTKSIVLTYEVNVEVPETLVYEMLVETFGNEVKEQLTNMLLGKINTEQIKTELKETIIKLIDKIYSV